MAWMARKAEQGEVVLIWSAEVVDFGADANATGKHEFASSPVTNPNSFASISPVSRQLVRPVAPVPAAQLLVLGAEAVGASEACAAGHAAGSARSGWHVRHATASAIRVRPGSDLDG